jgi:ankyrin repeat protein
MRGEHKHLVLELLRKYDIDLNIDLSKHVVTPLYHAAQLEDVQLVKIFFDKRADPTVESFEGTPPIRAIEKDNEELVSLLVHKIDRTHCTQALGQAVR